MNTILFYYHTCPYLPAIIRLSSLDMILSHIDHKEIIHVLLRCNTLSWICIILFIIVNISAFDFDKNTSSCSMFVRTSHQVYAWLLWVSIISLCLMEQPSSSSAYLKVIVFALGLSIFYKYVCFCISHGTMLVLCHTL